MSPTLFYDGNCPLCAKEIAVLRNKSKGALIFLDVHQQDDASLQRLQLKREDLLMQLHLLYPNGFLLTGLDANIAAWHCVGGHTLLRLLMLPGFYWCAKKVYYFWAKYRYRRLYCGAKNCSVKFR